MSELEQLLATLTEPIGDQYPRPWMSALDEPETAEVFIVGQNQAKRFPDTVSHQRFVDSLYNRNGETGRALYDEITGCKPSKTRARLDALASQLCFARTLETNVVCFSTESARELDDTVNAEGRTRGAKVFETILAYIQPKLLITHGVGTLKLAAELVPGFPGALRPAETADELRPRQIRLSPLGSTLNTTLIAIPTQSVHQALFKNWATHWPSIERRLVYFVRQLV
ncbi:MAG TPA: hypothetical protein VE422_28485 [Terriglobia bacterium]|nr:hypothetical protein [Terriglobia bacterium]